MINFVKLKSVGTNIIGDPLHLGEMIFHNIEVLWNDYKSASSVKKKPLRHTILKINMITFHCSSNLCLPSELLQLN